jgi:hypothetical protein
MVISFSCSALPSSSWYTGTGSSVISLAGVTEIISNTKKSLIKIQIPQSSGSYTSTLTDRGKNYVKDLKRVEDTIKIRGWLIDTTASSAWNQAWQLRGMAAKGGPIDLFTIENITFNTSSQQAFLEEVNFIAKSSESQPLGLRINETGSIKGLARIEIDLQVYLGDNR